MTTKKSKVLDLLIEGNKRFVNNKSENPNRNEERRKAISSKQSPFAIIVGCSDSRVSPEIIFDVGLGDLFVVRVAGNVIGSIELESIEYSALNLNSSIILVLGHENCRAVNAVVQNKTANLEKIAELIEPSVKKEQESETNNILEQAIKTNALNMKDLLEKSPNIEKLIQDKKIEVHAAYYNLKTGLVELLSKD
ncbi:MAG: Carbonic anhydrase 2 [Candidatus Anoxychlamydiales bacterium]|nr:Carbonic anhydrase 2 [Candidatus Anoxychlamydiales bacterium]